MIYETSIESKLISIFEGMEIETVFQREKHKYYGIMGTSVLLGLSLLVFQPPVIFTLVFLLGALGIGYAICKKYDESSKERYLEEFKAARDKIKEVFPDKEDVELMLDATKSALDRESAFNFTLLGAFLSIIILLGDKIIDFGSTIVGNDGAFEIKVSLFTIHPAWNTMLNISDKIWVEHSSQTGTSKWSWLSSIADVPTIYVILLVIIWAISIYAFHAAQLNRKHTNVAMFEAILLNWDQMITIEDRAISTEETSSETK